MLYVNCSACFVCVTVLFTAQSNAIEPGEQAPRIQHVADIELKEGSLYCAAFSPDGRWIVACAGRTVKLFDLTNRQLLRTFSGHSADVLSVAFSPDGKTLASSSRDRTIRIWEPRSGKLLRLLRGHSAPVTHVEFSPDGKSLLSAAINPGGANHEVMLWDPIRGQWEHRLRTGSGQVSKERRKILDRRDPLDVTFSPNGKHVAVAEREGNVVVYDVAFGLRDRFIKQHGNKQSAYHVCFSPDNTKLYSCGSDNRIRAWDVQTGRLLLKLSPPSSAGNVRAVTLFSGGSILISVTDNETLQAWSTSKGQLLTSVAGTGKSVRGLVLSPDEKTLATYGSVGKIKLWHLSLPPQQRSVPE